MDINILLPVAQVKVSLIGLVGLGLLIGFLSGMFGVGGGFLLTPMLNAVFGIPYHVAVGSSLCQMIGTGAAGSLRHRSYGNIDYRLALFTLIGSILGVELGAQFLMMLKGWGSITIYLQSVTKMYLVMSVIYIFLLSMIGVFMFREARQHRNRKDSSNEVLTGIAYKVRQIKFFPLISLPASRINCISLWVTLFCGFCLGILSGLLGVGGGFIFLPILIYILGISTSIAVGTSLFQIIFISSYGSVSHLAKGNIDFYLVAPILAGSLIGSQMGAVVNNKMKGSSIRYYFSWVVFSAAVIILIRLFSSLGYV